MDICYASNETYVPHLAASMTSLILHNADAGVIRFHVIANGIGEESRQKLRQNAALAVRQCADIVPTVSVSFYDLSDLAERVVGQGAELAGTAADSFSRQAAAAKTAEGGTAETAADRLDTGSYDISMLGRFFIGELLPERVETVLYLDCDTIVCGSLKQLFQRTGLPLASGVPEPTIYRSILKQLGLTHADDCYINSGVLLINLAAWREFDAGRRLLIFYRENGARLFCGDQDAVNYVLRGKIGLLSPRYNFFTNYRYFHYRSLVRQSPSYERVMPNRQQFEKMKQKPRIIHYMGAERPWLHGNRNPYRRQYEAALSRTVYAGRKPERGKEAALFAYHLMNLGTWLCPPLRRIISAAFERKKVRPRIEPLLTDSGNMSNIEENSRK